MKDRFKKLVLMVLIEWVKYIHGRDNPKTTEKATAIIYNFVERFTDKYYVDTDKINFN